MSQPEPKITLPGGRTEDEGGEGECFVVCLSCMLRYLCYILCVCLSVLLVWKKKMFQVPQSLRFSIRAWLHICIKSAGLGLWWTLPGECFRGRGPGRWEEPASMWARLGHSHLWEGWGGGGGGREEGKREVVGGRYVVINKIKTEEERKINLCYICQFSHTYGCLRLWFAEVEVKLWQTVVTEGWGGVSRSYEPRWLCSEVRKQAICYHRGFWT